MTWQTDSKSSAATEQLGEQVGKRLKGGEIIELISDLGGGKTTFVRGLARGLGSRNHVASPTFTISKVYQSKKLELHHFDFYRLSDPGHVAHELAEAVNQPKVAVVVEWGKLVEQALPAGRLSVSFLNQGGNRRQLKFSYPKSLARLLKDLK